ncbi:MAG: serine hydrolase domain-containing protein [Promethearchaeota archaeon]
MASKVNHEHLIETLNEKVLEFIEKVRVEGVSVALIRDANIIWSEGFGYRNKEKGLPVTPKTIFEAASLTKPVAAYITLQFCHEGLIDLDTPLNDYLPAPYLKDEPLLEFITTRHVLSHTTGFPNWGSEEIPLKVYFTPGERFSYSGEGFMYLQRVLEHLTGKSFESIAQQRVFVPLGIENASMIWQGTYKELSAIGHYRKGTIRKKWRPSKAFAASSLHIAPSGYAKFLIELMQDDSSKKIPLSEDFIAEMFSPRVPVNNAGLASRHDWPKSQVIERNDLFWGLGWGLEKSNDKSYFWHWGDNEYFHCFTAGCREEKSAFIMMTNSRKAQIMTKTKKVLRAYKGILEGAMDEEGGKQAIDWLASFVIEKNIN